MARWIIHVDMDEFFAAVEKLDRPELRGKPLLVGGDPAARGVVSTASYEARAFGCHSAMPMATAMRLCPQAIVLPVRGDRYEEVSGQVFAILDRFTPLVEPASIDEAFLDVTGCEKLFGPPPTIAAAIRGAIRSEIGLTASLGVAPNKFLAKLGSDLEKPGGLVVIAPETIRATLDPLPVRKIWGVGPVAEKRLAKLGVKTIGQLRSTPIAALRPALGNVAEEYVALAEGLDDRPVVPRRDPKSLGQEETFAEDSGDLDHLRATLLKQVEEVARRLRRERLEAKTITVKLRYGDFTTISKSVTLPDPINTTDELWKAASGVLDAWAREAARPLRLIGMYASNVRPAGTGQLSLLADPAHARGERLDRAIDAIVERFGGEAIERARARRQERRRDVD